MDNTNIPSIVKEYRDSGIEEQIDFKKFYLYSLVTCSTALEGSTLTGIENQLLFDEDIPAAGKPIMEHMMNLDLRDAYLFGYSLIDKKVPLDKKVLKSLAANVMRRTGTVYKTMAGEFDSSKGDLRLCNVTAGVGGKSYLSYLKVPGRFEEFVLWLSDALSHLDRSDIYQCYALSFEAHFRLVTIHPWVDGNGRTTRLLMNLIQYMAGVPQSRILLKDKARYVQALIETREKDDIQLFIDVMMKLHSDDLLSQMSVYRKSLEDDHVIGAKTKGQSRRTKGKALPGRIDPEDERIKELHERLRYKLLEGSKEREIMMRFCEYVCIYPYATITEITKYLGMSYEKVSFYIEMLTMCRILKREVMGKTSHWIFDRSLFEDEDYLFEDDE